MPSTVLCLFLFLLSYPFVVSSSQVIEVEHSSLPAEPFSPFTDSLKNLEKQMNYAFEDINLLGSAMTHASYSQENNKALSILGSRVLEGSLVLRLLNEDLDISVSDLSSRILEFSRETSCADAGLRLGLEKVIRVSANTNSSAPGVVCGAFRAIFAAVAIDSESLDTGGRVFWEIKNVAVGKAMAM